MTRTTLVLTDETARHWLRQRFPKPVPMRPGRMPLSDAKLFWLTFASAFIAFYGFIA